MVFAHDTELSLQAAVSLVNSAEPPDTLTSHLMDVLWLGFAAVRTGGRWS